MNKAKNEWSSFCNIVNYFKVEKKYSIRSFCDGQINVEVTSKDYYKLLKDFFCLKIQTQLEMHQLLDHIDLMLIQLFQ